MNLLPSRQLPWWQKLLSLVLQLVVFVLLSLMIGLLLELLGEQLLPSHWLEEELPSRSGVLRLLDVTPRECQIRRSLCTGFAVRKYCLIQKRVA